MTLSPTFQIPGYTIEKTLGAGGMARVFLAVQNSLNRQVALKVLTLADPQFQNEISQERYAGSVDSARVFSTSMGGNSSKVAI